MTSLSGANGFNNLLFAKKQLALAETLERSAGHTPLDLSSKREKYEVLNLSRTQLNGKKGDIVYKPKVIRSMPDLSYDEGFDPTLLNASRNILVDVSGILIPSKDLPKKTNLNTTVRPLVPYGVIR